MRPRALHVHFGGRGVSVGQPLVEGPVKLARGGHAADGGPLHVHGALLVAFDLQAVSLGRGEGG